MNLEKNKNANAEKTYKERKQRKTLSENIKNQINSDQITRLHEKRLLKLKNTIVITKRIKE